MAKLGVRVTSATEKTSENDMDRIFRLLKLYMPEEEIIGLNYCQSISAGGGITSTLKFERVIDRSTLNLNKNTREYLDEKMPQALVRYVRKWEMFDENTHIRCVYDIFIPNPAVIVSLMEKGLYVQYSNEFDAEIDKTLKSE